MYELKDFNNLKNDKEKLEFINLYKTTWDKIHINTDIFRYKVKQLRERTADGKYLLQLNPNRSSKRRTPEHIENICQPFDDNKFNFTKVSANEILFTIVENGYETDKHALLVNVSPISQYHSLLCPSIHKCLPQVVTAESLQLMINIIFLAQDRDLRIGFNSLCGLASVNHLHYHLLIEKNVLPIETAKCEHLRGPVYILSEEYPVPAFCFQVTPQTDNPSRDIYKTLKVLLDKAIAHNIFMTLGKTVTEDCNREEIVRVVIWPRKSSAGAKQLSAFNVAVCELSGWFPVYDEDVFENIRSEELEDELRKWRIDNFDDLCEDIKMLY